MSHVSRRYYSLNRIDKSYHPFIKRRSLMRFLKSKVFLKALPLGLVALFLVISHLPASASRAFQTIPTRTPTPPPGPTSPPPTPGGGGQDTPTPPGDSTPIPTSTTSGATVTPIQAADTPEGGYLPTAEACDSPTLQVFSGVNVRSGPGTSYDVIYLMVYLEVRPIIGRAAASRWWQISLPDDDRAWVADNVVIVSGNTNIVPIVEAPLLNGSTATPGVQWNPVNPDCPFSATSTPFPTTQAQTRTATPQVTTTASRTPTPGVTGEPEEAGTATIESTDTVEPSPSAGSSETPQSTVTAEVDIDSEEPDALESTGDEELSGLPEPDTGQGSNWLLYGGVGVLIAGILLYFTTNRRQ